MSVVNRLSVLIAGSLLAAGCSTAAPADTSENAPVEQSASASTESVSSSARIEKAAAGSHRSEENRARDKYRHPVETLSFFGLEPSMTVVELSPGTGWYTEIIAPVVRDEGKLVIGNAVVVSPEHYTAGMVAKLSALFESHPDIFDKVDVGIFAPPERIELGPAESAEMVVSFRSIHGWISAGLTDQAFGAVYDVLKPGGIFGVVQHRAAKDVEPIESAKTGYVPEAYVIELAEAAGFELVDRSDINANPKDTHDHEHGVWSLAPSYRAGDTDREKFEEIGESDRMTLKFRKPVSK